MLVPTPILNTLQHFDIHRNGTIVLVTESRVDLVNVSLHLSVCLSVTQLIATCA